MSMRYLSLIVFLTSFSHQISAAEYEYTTVVPKRKPAIAAQGVKGQKLNQVKIDADPSIDLVQAIDVTITACELKSIKLSGCKKIRIYNCWIHDSKAPAIHLDGCEDVVVQGCRIERVASGVYAHQSSGVQVVGNYVENVMGPMPRGQMVQFDKVTGKQNVIRGNQSSNSNEQSRPEDMISIYESSGTEDSPILIEDNFLSGDPKVGSDGKSKSGSGIMLNDRSRLWSARWIVKKTVKKIWGTLTLEVSQLQTKEGVPHGRHCFSLGGVRQAKVVGAAKVSV